MSNERLWFETKLDQDEAILEKKGVPKQFWGYILANGAPGSENHDKLGAIYNDRQYLLGTVFEISKTMAVTVVDGFDLETIRKWIGGPDWTPSEENKWMTEMKAIAVDGIDKWEAEGPYTFERLLDWVMRMEDYDFCALLDRIAHRFPVDELDRVVGPRGRCPSEKYDRYCEATDEWTAIPTNGKFSDDQLSVLARHNQIVTPVDVSVLLVEMSPIRRWQMFKLMRDHHRDRSPKRK
jgi:hypothetical protein